jgi:hypothetical protein
MCATVCRMLTADDPTVWTFKEISLPGIEPGPRPSQSRVRSTTPQGQRLRLREEI